MKAYGKSAGAENKEKGENQKCVGQEGMAGMRVLAFPYKALVCNRSLRIGHKALNICRVVPDMLTKY